MDKTLLILGVELRQAFRAGSSAEGKPSRVKQIAKNIVGYAVLLAVAVFMGRGAYNIAVTLSGAFGAYPGCGAHCLGESHVRTRARRFHHALHDWRLGGLPNPV